MFLKVRETMTNSLYRRFFIKYMTSGHSTKRKDWSSPIRTRIKEETKKEIKDYESNDYNN